MQRFRVVRSGPISTYGSRSRLPLAGRADIWITFSFLAAVGPKARVQARTSFAARQLPWRPPSPHRRLPRLWGREVLEARGRSTSLPGGTAPSGVRQGVRQAVRVCELRRCSASHWRRPHTRTSSTWSTAPWLTPQGRRSRSTQSTRWVCRKAAWTHGCGRR